MQKVQRKQKNEDAKKVVMLVAKLNQYRHEYYNKAKPSVPDAVYDHLFDELKCYTKVVTGVANGI